MEEDNFWQRIKKEVHYLSNSDWSLKEVGEHWDQTIDYDEINEKTYSYFRRFTDGLRLCSFPDQSYILDICSRTGNGTLYFWQNNKARKAVCADLTLKMQEICKKQLSEAGIDFRTQFFDNLPLPLPDNEFEAVLCFETVEHFPRPGVLIKEMARVTKPKGEVVITTPNILWEPIHSLAAIFNIHHSEGPHRFLRRRSMHKFIKEAGMNIEKEEATVFIPAGPKFLIKFGEWVERNFKNTLMPLLGLRRIFICRKQV